MLSITTALSQARPARLVALLAALVCAGPALAQPGDGVEFGGAGEPARDAAHPCISAEQRAAVQAIVQANRRALGLDQIASPAGPMTYDAWPQAGNLGQDIFPGYLFDLNSLPNALRDFDCGDWTYDGHTGNDIGLKSFAEQIIGVPIFAALDGVVVATDDGHPDMNTVWNNQPANFVVLDHGGNRQTYYWHMKNGSVAVTVGQHVRAGTQLGQTASSGISTGPHLHFETVINGGSVEPWAGACRFGPSLFTRQPEIDRTTMAFRDFGFNNTSLSSWAGYPTSPPRVSHGAFTDNRLYFWMQGYNLPAGSTTRFVFIRPDNTTAFDSGQRTITFATTFYRSYFMWWNFPVTDLRFIAGTWHVRVSINNEQLIDAPFEVKETREPNFNRAPRPVEVAFDPVQPDPTQPLFCRVETSMTLDDPDYDVVSYRYVWRVRGAVVRDVLTAAYSDAIPAGSFALGDGVTCDVTPTDGRLNGPTASTGGSTNCDPPTITGQPSDSAVNCRRTPAGFSVTATGGTFRYLWQVRGGPLADWTNLFDGRNSTSGGEFVANASGSSEPSLVLDHGDTPWVYPVEARCVVSNPCGVVFTRTASTWFTNSCIGDFSCDGFIDGFDYSEFVFAFETGDPAADVNHDDFVDFFDYDDFVNSFETGC